jgi:hypothetical protein
VLTEQDPNFERRADEITAGMEPYIRKHLLKNLSHCTIGLQDGHLMSHSHINLYPESLHSNEIFIQIPMGSV